MVNTVNTGARSSVLSRIKQFEQNQPQQKVNHKYDASNGRESSKVDTINERHDGREPQQLALNQKEDIILQSRATEKVVVSSRNLSGQSNYKKPVALKNDGVFIEKNNQAVGKDPEQDKSKMWQVRKFQQNGLDNNIASSSKSETFGNRKISDNPQNTVSGNSKQHEQRGANSRQRHSADEKQLENRKEQSQAENSTSTNNFKTSNAMIQSRMQVFDHSHIETKKDEKFLEGKEQSVAGISDSLTPKSKFHDKATEGFKMSKDNRGGDIPRTRSLHKSSVNGVPEHSKNPYPSSLPNPHSSKNGNLPSPMSPNKATEVISPRKTPKSKSSKEVMHTYSPHFLSEKPINKSQNQKIENTVSPQVHTMIHSFNTNDAENQTLSALSHSNKSNVAEITRQKQKSPWAGTGARTDMTSQNRMNGMRQDKKVNELRIQTDSNKAEFGSPLNYNESLTKAPSASIENRHTPIHNRIKQSPRDSKQSDTIRLSPRLIAARSQEQRRHLYQGENSPHHSSFFGDAEGAILKKNDTFIAKVVVDNANDDESFNRNPSPESSRNVVDQRKDASCRSPLQASFYQKISSKGSAKIDLKVNPSGKKKSVPRSSDKKYQCNDKKTDIRNTKFEQDETDDVGNCSLELPTNETASLTSASKESEKTPVRNHKSNIWDGRNKANARNTLTAPEVRPSPKNFLDVLGKDGENKTKSECNPLKEQVTPDKPDRASSETSSPSEKSNCSSTSNPSPHKRNLFMRASRTLKERRALKDRNQHIQELNAYHPLNSYSSGSGNFSFDSANDSYLSKSLPTSPKNGHQTKLGGSPQKSIDDRSLNSTLDATLSPRSRLAGNIHRLKIIKAQRLERQRQFDLDKKSSDNCFPDKVPMNDNIEDTFEMSLKNPKLLEPSLTNDCDTNNSTSNLLCGQQDNFLKATKCNQTSEKINTSDTYDLQESIIKPNILCGQQEQLLDVPHGDQITDTVKLSDTNDLDKLTPQMKTMLESSALSLKQDSAVVNDNVGNEMFSIYASKLQSGLLLDSMASCTDLSAVSDIIPNLQQVSAFFLGKENKKT